jgi:mannosyl-oligosaccharide glucosidase
LIHVVHKGYITIFPVLLGLLPADSQKLGKLLKLIRDPKELWSEYGICSLSKKDHLHGQGENYWRGPIWMPINFLLLKSLKENYLVPGPNKDLAERIYNELKANLIKNIFSSYASTGFVWEQYSCDSGKGSRSHPFTGWTSLALLAMAEKY